MSAYTRTQLAPALSWYGDVPQGEIVAIIQRALDRWIRVEHAGVRHRNAVECIE